MRRFMLIVLAASIIANSADAATKQRALTKAEKASVAAAIDKTLALNSVRLDVIRKIGDETETGWTILQKPDRIDGFDVTTPEQIVEVIQIGTDAYANYLAPGTKDERGTFVHGTTRAVRAFGMLEIYLRPKTFDRTDGTEFRGTLRYGGRPSPSPCVFETATSDRFGSLPSQSKQTHPPR